MRRRSFPGFRGRGFVVSRRHQTYGRSRRQTYGRSPYQTGGANSAGCSLLMMLGVVVLVLVWLTSAH